MIRAYYTGSQTFRSENKVPSKSVGGWISCTNIRTKSIYGLFDNILTYEDRSRRCRYRVIAIRNEFPFAIRDVRMYISFKLLEEERLVGVESSDKRTDAEKVADYFSLRARYIAPTEEGMGALDRAENDEAGYVAGFMFPLPSDDFTNLYGEHYDITPFDSRLNEDGNVLPSRLLPTPLVGRLEPNAYYGISIEQVIDTQFINRKKTEEELLRVLEHPAERPFDSKLCDMSIYFTAHDAATEDPPEITSPNI